MAVTRGFYSGQDVIAADGTYFADGIYAYVDQSGLTCEIPTIEIAITSPEGSMFVTVEEFRAWVAKIEERFAETLTP